MCAGCSVGDDVFRDAGFVTETRAGMCRGVVRPRTRGWWAEDDLQENPEKTINTCSFRVAHNYTWHVDNRQLLS